MSRDIDVYDSILGLLKATNAFDGVYFGALPSDRGQPASDLAAVAVAPASWREQDDYDDPTTVQSTRKVTWTLTLFVRNDDPYERVRTLDRLVSLCQDTLDGQCLAGLTIPDWTRLASGTYANPSSPEQRMTVTGSFAYLVEGFTGHDDS